ncbi:hypothetical protein EON64_07040 [archaeon]|nr:MAG: hypothetical protein EON64_07040 [archaeon]
MMVTSGVRNIYEDMLTWQDWKLHLIAMFAEFVGTTSFLWLAFAAQTFAAIPATSVAGNGNPNNPGNVLYVALAFAFSYAINLWLFNPLSGGFFNPAVTLALMIVEHLSLARGLLLIIIQFAAGKHVSVLS